MVNKRELSDYKLDLLLDRLDEGDEKARVSLTEAYISLVFDIAKSSKFALAPVEKDDLVSYGFIGLLKGIDTFSSSKFSDFNKYLNYCITYEMSKFCSSIHPIDTISLDEIKEKEYNNDNGDFIDYKSDLNTIVEKQNIINRVNSIVNNLNPRYKSIIKLYFDGALPHDIASTLKLNEEYVEKVIKICISSIKSDIGKNGLIRLYSEPSIKSELDSCKQK